MICYRNTAGVEISLMDHPYMLDITDLAGFIMNYDTNLYTDRNGGRIENFSIGVIEKPITVGFCGTSVEIMAAMDRILEVTQYDVQRNAAGRFYIDDSYILCNLIGSEANTIFDPDIEFAEKTYTLAISYPYWCTEKTIDYFPEEDASGGEYLDYPHDYPYDYRMDDSSYGILENDHYADSDFQMIVYGPAVNPMVTIGGHPYQVTVTLYDNEYMLIDSRMSKVVRVMTDGTEVNLWNYRAKQNSIFQKIPAGNSAVIADKTFGFTITLFQERSEPKWSLS